MGLGMVNKIILTVFIFSLLLQPAAATETTAPGNYTQYLSVMFPEDMEGPWDFVVGVYAVLCSVIGAGMLWTLIMGSVTVSMCIVQQSLDVIAATYMTLGAILVNVLPDWLAPIFFLIWVIALMSTMVMLAKRR